MPSDLVAFPGVRGSGSWSTDERPKNYREMILWLYPNGMMPLTALLSMLGSESTDDPEYNWWTKTVPSQRSAITEGDVHTVNTLDSKAQWDSDTAANNDFDKDETVYVKIATDTTAQMKKYRVGHVIMLRDASNYAHDVRCKVTAKATDYLTCKVLKTYAGSSTVATDNTYDTIIIIGNVNEENAVRPASVSYDPVKFSNYTQIFRTPLEISRTAQKTKLRTGPAYERMKREALEIHGIEREKAFIWGVPTENTGSGGLPERTTGGIVDFIKTNVPTNIKDFTSDAAGNTWLGAGEDWLDEKLEQIFRYGSPTKLALCGSGAMLGINKLAKASGYFNISVATASYGIQVVKWVTPFGELLLKTHPLFSYEATDRNTMLILDTKNIKTRVLDDTFFKPDKAENESTGDGRDGKKEEFITEDGLELHHPDTFGILYNVGIDG